MSENCSAQKPSLDRLYISSPCSVPWDSMSGDSTKRLCGGCSKNVFNISDMTKTEVDSFLAKNGYSQCMTFFRRTDGTIMTDNCPRVLRKLRDRCRIAVRVAAGAIAVLLSLPVFAQNAMAKRVHQVIDSKTGVSAPVSADQISGGGTAGFYSSKTGTDKGAISPLPRIDKGLVRLRAVQTIYMDTKANELYHKGKAAETSGKATLAEFYYERAIDSFKQSKVKGDAKFLQEMETALKKLTTK